MRKKLNENEIIKALTLLEEMHPEAMCALDHRDNFELIVAVVLSAQTTDVSVNKVTPALFEAYPDAKTVSKADPEAVADIIRTIGLYKNKSVNIVKLANKLCEDFGGEVPSDFDSLVSLPGVGRKTANVVLAEAFDVPAIAVDTHVFRVSNRIGFANAKDVDKTEEQLRKRIPKDSWIRAHHLIIFHGRKICHARKPDCDSCKIKDICLYYADVNSCLK